MHLGPFLDDDQGTLELPHVLGVDPEVGLQRDVHLDTGRHVDERPAAPDRRVEGGELVVLDRDDRAEVLLDQVGILAQRRVGVDEDDPLLLEVLPQAVIDDFRLVLRPHAGQELALGLGDAQLVEGVLDLGRHVVPGLALAVGRLHKIADVVEIQLAEVATPVRHGLLAEGVQRLEPELAHPVGLALHLGDLVDNLAREALAAVEGVVIDRVAKAVLVVVLDAGHLKVQIGCHRAWSFVFGMNAEDWSE